MTSRATDLRAAVALTRLERTIENIIGLVAKGRDVVEADEFLPLAAQGLAFRLGQDVGNLPEDKRAQHPEVPWRALRALGKRIENHPREIGLDTLWDVFAVEVPAIRRALSTHIAAAREPLEATATEEGADRKPATSL